MVVSDPELSAAPAALQRPQTMQATSQTMTHAVFVAVVVPALFAAFLGFMLGKANVYFPFVCLWAITAAAGNLLWLFWMGFLFQAVQYV